MVPPYLQITHCVHSALGCFKMTTYIFTHFCLVSFLLTLYYFSILISETFISIQARSYSRDGNGHIHQNISPISPQILVFNRGMSMRIYLLLKLHLVFKISLFQMALYADSERGRYPVWQSLDHPNFFPGSRIVFVTVTVSLYSIFISHTCFLGPINNNKPF